MEIQYGDTERKTFNFPQWASNELFHFAQWSWWSVWRVPWVWALDTAQKSVPPIFNRTYSWKCVAKTREGFGVCFPMSNPRPSSSHWFYGTGLPDLISFKTTRVSSEHNWWFHTLELYGLAYQWVNSIRMAAFLPIGNLFKCWPSMKSKTHLFNCSAPIYCKSETTLTPQTVDKK